MSCVHAAKLSCHTCGVSLHSGGANQFLYTRQGRSPVIDGVDDTKELGTTRQAFALLGNASLLRLTQQNVHAATQAAQISLRLRCF